MKLSQTGMGTTKLNNIDKAYPGQSILLQTGQLVQFGAGIFAYNNIPLLINKKLEETMEETLNKYGCIQILLPDLQPDKIWKDSGRYEQYIDNGTMLITESSKGTFCLAPTGEEAVLEFAREKLKSYKNFPVTYYQIGDKVRNEIRTRGYLLRGKLFRMLDAYSFDTNPEGAEKAYKNLRKAFMEFFEKIGMDVIPIIADNGDMGGKTSEEFMVISEQGEDKILYDEKTGIGLNTEILEKENYEEYLKEEYGVEDISGFKETRAIELGHIFNLGTRYSEMMNGKFINQDGKEGLYYMGCYGIGVSRTLAAFYEKHVITDKKGEPCGFAFPVEMAPYKVQIIPKLENEEKVKFANEIYDTLNKNGIKAILDDREKITIGAKIKDTKILGTPYIIVLGDKTEGETIELENSKTGEVEKTTLQELIKKFSN